MELLHPRRVYQRANSTEPGIHDDNLEMESMYSMTTSEHDPFPSQQYNSEHRLRTNPDEVPLIKPSTHAKWFSGWRAGAYSAAGLALCSLCVNIAAAIWLSNHPNAESSLVEVYRGSCDTVTHLDTWVHLAINVLSTLLLGGSNYCKFLDIGVPSIRNLHSIAKYKVVMWWLLGLSSIPLHLMYNSAFYSSLATNEYEYYIVSSDFFSNENTSSAYPEALRAYGTPEDFRNDLIHNETLQFERLDPLSCIEAYGQIFMQDYRNLVLVSRNSSTTSNSTVFFADFYNFAYHVSPSDQIYKPFHWLCYSDPRIDQKINVPGQYERAPCDSFLDRVEAISDDWQPEGYDIDYCLAERIDQQCSFNGNIPIVAVVIVCNTIKVLLMLVVAYRLTGYPLITIGDALESFLDLPDVTTQNICLFTRGDAQRWQSYRQQAVPKKEHYKGQRGWKYYETVTSKTVKLRTLRWSAAASRRRWTWTIGLLILALLVVLGLVGAAISVTKNKVTSVLSLGFGTVQPSAIIAGWAIEKLQSTSFRIIASIFIANLPQAILSFLYLNLNGLLTSMWVAKEYSDFATERKYLRVSTPKGQQRSTHFLQLPYKVAVPLMTISGLLHWLVSQSIFLAVVAVYDQAGDLRNATQIASCGFSPLPMICVLVIGVLLVLGTYLVGRGKYDPSMPLAGSCSAAISAACHRPEWDSDAAVNPVQWGAVPGFGADLGVGHCCFTSGDVEPVQEGREYAGRSTIKLRVVRKGLS